MVFLKNKTYIEKWYSLIELRVSTLVQAIHRNVVAFFKMSTQKGNISFVNQSEPIEQMCMCIYIHVYIFQISFWKVNFHRSKIETDRSTRTEVQLVQIFHGVVLTIRFGWLRSCL